MKVSIGTKIKDGPWGGGNLFAINLRDYLIKKGHDVVYNLDDDDIDIILITEPRKSSESSAFTHVDVKKYVDYINKETLVFHRINECDERKNTNYVNKYLINVNQIADQTIFVSKWLKQLYESQGINLKNNNVIMAGANSSFFNNRNFIPWQKGEKIKIVTHHWGANWNKGFDSYVIIDNLISENKWKDRIEFTYIGNLPNKFSFKNSKVVSPLSGQNLAEEIQKNNLYITGSLNEPSGNHHIEAAQSGLPILYIDSGGIPEYCETFGVMYNLKNLEIKLEEIIASYQEIEKNLKSYPFSSELMCEDYLKLFEKSLSNRQTFLHSRVLKANNSFFFKKLFHINRKIRKNIFMNL
tara:strand:- start:2437 stop:3498 length:1062 start_codon:yes stop_codon:yes gene_type:complete